jgi:uncharacterized membrane protein
VGTAFLVGTYGASRGWSALAEIPAVAGTVWLSRLAILGGAIEGNPWGPWSLGLVAWVLDLIAAVILLSGVGGLDRMRVSGAWLRRMRWRAIKTLVKFPGLERTAIFGVGLLVFIPIPGSGSVVGTLLGQVVGLTRTATLASVAVGSGLSIIAIAMTAHYLGDRWDEIAASPGSALAGGALVCILFWLAWLRVRRQLRRT